MGVQKLDNENWHADPKVLSILKNLWYESTDLQQDVFIEQVIQDYGIEYRGSMGNFKINIVDKNKFLLFLLKYS